MLLFNDQRRRQQMKMEARIIRIIGLLAILTMLIVVYLNIHTIVETQNENPTERKLKGTEILHRMPPLYYPDIDPICEPWCDYLRCKKGCVCAAPECIQRCRRKWNEDGSAPNYQTMNQTMK